MSYTDHGMAWNGMEEGIFTGHSHLRKRIHEILTTTAVNLMIYDGYVLPTSIYTDC